MKKTKKSLKTNNLKSLLFFLFFYFIHMASYDDFQTAICSGGGGGWWNPSPGRSPFPFSPSAAPLTNFMWSDSSLNNYIHDDQAEMKLQAAAAAATYSRSDDSSNDRNSSSAMSSEEYAQMFQHDPKLPQGTDHFSASDWSQNTNLINQGFYNPGQQFETTLQTDLAEPGTDMNYDVFDSSFSATANWPKMLLSPSPKQQLNGGTKQKHSNTNNSPNPFWDCWMGSDEISTPALFEDQKSYNCGSKEMAQKVATKRKTTTSDEMYKRPRIETPSSLPTFKVRKEKLGDRITALQQLVSPFGKTDTASVLHEAIEYIKFLHDQVSVLRTPYMQNGTSKNQHQQKQGESKSTASKQDLISRGLCLVPISSTFPVANEATSGFWTGTMTFR